MAPDGATPTVHFPTHREIAERLGIGQSTVTEFAARHNTKRRRAEAKAKLATKVEERILEMRGERIALSLDEILAGIDEYARQFHQALLRREVRADVPADYDRLMRLRLHLTGGPDARVEVHTTFSLESVQSRHAELVERFRDSTPMEAGVVDAELIEVVPISPTNPPSEAAADPKAGPDQPA